jgi:hypothetical protein
MKKTDLQCKMGEFVLTWSRRIVVSSTVAPIISTFFRGGLLAPESISKLKMVIMSYQRLFIEFFGIFLSFFPNWKSFTTVWEVSLDGHKKSIFGQSEHFF